MQESSDFEIFHCIPQKICDWIPPTLTHRLPATDHCRRGLRPRVHREL